MKCAEERLSAEQIRERVAFGKMLVPADASGQIKAAGEGSSWFPWLSNLWSATTAWPRYVWPWVVPAGAGAGILGGYTMAKMTDQDADPEMAKQYELIAAYKQQAERARRQAQATAHRAAKPRPSGPRLL
jgi:hypothetical protein